MVAIETVLFVDVQRDAAMGRQGLEELAHQFGVKTADLGRGEIQIADQIGACRQIQRAGDLRVIHRKGKMPIAADALFVAQGFAERLAQGNAHIFDGVVIIDVQIAFGGDGHVDQRMLGQLVQHMVKKPHAGGDFGASCAIEGNRDGNRCLRRCAGYSGVAHRGLPRFGVL